MAVTVVDVRPFTGMENLPLSRSSLLLFLSSYLWSISSLVIKMAKSGNQ